MVLFTAHNIFNILKMTIAKMRLAADLIKIIKTEILFQQKLHSSRVEYIALVVALNPAHHSNRN